MKLTKTILFVAAMAAGTLFAAEPAAKPQAAPATTPAPAPQQAQITPEQIAKQNEKCLDDFLKDAPMVLGEVDGNKLTKPEFKKFLIDVKFPACQLSKVPADKKAGILKNFIMNYLLETPMKKEAERAGFKFTIDYAFNLVITDFKKAPEQQQAMIREEIKKKHNKDVETYLKDMLKENPRVADGIVMQEFQQSLYKKNLDAINDAELREAYNKNKEEFKNPESFRVSHILIICPDKVVREKMGAQLNDEQKKRTDADAQKKINEIKARLDKGEDFAKVAKECSECPSKEQGGDLGPIQRGQMVPEFEKAAFALNKPGELSGVVKTPFGYHLIKLTEKKAESYEPFENVKESLKAQSAKEKTSKELEALVQGWEKSGRIKVYIQAPVPAAVKAPAAQPAAK